MRNSCSQTWYSRRQEGSWRNTSSPLTTYDTFLWQAQLKVRKAGAVDTTNKGQFLWAGGEQVGQWGLFHSGFSIAILGDWGCGKRSIVGNGESSFGQGEGQWKETLMHWVHPKFLNLGRKEEKSRLGYWSSHETKKVQKRGVSGPHKLRGEGQCLRGRNCSSSFS